MTVNASTAVQSSTYAVADAFRASDGVTNTDYNNPESCAHSGYSNDSWWQVELMPARNVSGVLIYFPSDCCSTFFLFYLALLTYSLRCSVFHVFSSPC